MSRNEERASNIEGAHPLSPMQEGMLFHTLLHPTSGIYLMQNRYRLEGAIDEDAFAGAWRDVVARHAALRSSFVWKNQKRPLQVVYRAVDLPFEVLDLRALDADAREARTLAELATERATGLDLGRAPPMRFRLIRLGFQTYELVHSFHHILLDEWCTSILMTDFFGFYELRTKGVVPSVLPARPYREYIDWLARRDPIATEAFFRETMRGFTVPTPLGLEDRLADGATGATEATDLALRLDAGSSAALNVIAQEHRLTLNTIVQGAWALVLGRYAGEPEVVFGVTVAGRPPELRGVESIVGLFINTLPLRIALPPDARVLPWLASLQEKNLSLRQYGHTPLVDVARWSEVERGRELFQTLFVFENAPIDPSLRESRLFRVSEVRDRVHTNYPLTVMGWPDDELGLKVSYDRTRISEASATRLLAHLRTVLEGIAARPSARLGELAVVTEGERTRALVDWNRTDAPTADLASYADAFEAQVRATPDAVAVTSRDESITYAVLDMQADAIARGLRAIGIGVEDLVAVLDDRGIDLVAAIVGTFKASAAYVPLEPGHPVARSAQVLAAARPRAILTRDAHRPYVEEALRASGITSTIVTRESLGNTGGPERERGGPRNLAYVLFTSGSTGAPKGAMVERRGMLNNMWSKVPRLGLGPGDVIAQTASQSFDISVWQLLTALLVGGTVDIVGDEVARDPARLLEHVERRGISVLEVVPGVLSGLLDAASHFEPRPSLATLRFVLPTGEALPAALARDWLRTYPTIPLVNAYGPAECSDDVSLHRLDVPPPDDEVHVAIGRPVDGLRLYVLDRHLDPAPVGVAGQVYVGGIGVGRGYAYDPRRTAVVFLPDPFSNELGSRLYATGDLGRYRSDGTIEFAGRADHQVKLRGFRIELGEIEARLGEHGMVTECAVVVREDAPGKRRLVGYVAPVAAADADLREFLEARLPSYMVPTTYVGLEALPRSSNGKIARRTLPAPASAEVEHVAPRTDDERALVAIWQEVLGVTQVSAIDSFFELGGHSLLLTQILARVRKRLHVDVPLRELFEHPTVEGHARAVLAARAEGPDALALAPIERREHEAPALSFAQERLWFLAQLDPSAASYNVPAAVRVIGALDLPRLERSITALVARHDALRMGFQDVDGRPDAVLAEVGEVRVSCVDLASLSDTVREDEARRVVNELAARPFDLAAPPLVRLAAIRLGAEEHVLVLVVHHIVSDGVSLEVMVRELFELYPAATEGRPPALAPLPIRYADFARWQRSWLEGPALERQLAYYRTRLAGAPSILALPTDRVRPDVRSVRGARHGFTLAPRLAAALRALARSEGTTPFVVLLAAFEALVGRYASQSSFCLGVPISGRAREELEGIVGLFVNTLVLRADVGDDLSFTALIANVRDEVVGAQAHADLPFDRLVAALKPSRALDRTPLFQVMFSYLEADRRGHPPGFELRSFDVDSGSAQFDLSLHLAGDPEGAIEGAFEYSTDLFEPATVRGMSDDLATLLEAIAARPRDRLSELPLPIGLRLTRTPEPVVAPTQPEDRAIAPAVPVATADEMESRLGRIWADVLGRSKVAASDDFFELGGDSILSLQVVARARQEGIRITARHVFQHATLAGLAAAACTHDGTLAAEQEPVLGQAPLLPIQHAFFARQLPNPHHANQALLLAVPERVDIVALARAFDAVLVHHDALRLRYSLDGATQVHAPVPVEVPVHRVDLRRAAESERTQVLEAHATRWQATLDLASGPILRAVLFDLGDHEPERLLVIAHHLVIDGVSWRIVLEDLEAAYRSARAGEAVVLPEKTTSFKQWAERLHASANTSSLVADAARWLDLPWDRVRSIPVDMAEGDRTGASMATHSVAIDVDATRALLEEVPSAYRTRVEEVMLTALAVAAGRVTGHTTIAIDVESHGREGLGDEDLNLSRTVGWFTSAHPVVLDLSLDHGPDEWLPAAKEQLRALPRHGLAYGVVRTFGVGEIAANLRQLPAPTLAFNYLGQWDATLGDASRFSLAPESSGVEHDPRNHLPYEVEIDAAIFEHQLEATFRFSRARMSAASIERFAEAFRDALLACIAHCLAPEAGRYTPSDFPDVALDALELDSLLKRMD